MKFRALVSAAIGAFLAVSSARAGIFDIPVLIKPAAAKIKTVAVISAYMNSDFYNLESPRDSVTVDLFGKGSEKGGVAAPAKEQEDLLNYGVASFQSRLDGLGGWKWSPAAETTSNTAFKKFAESYSNKEDSSGLLKAAADLRKMQWCVAPGMPRVPADSIKPGKFISIGGAQDPRLALAALCRDLNVDAVAVLEFDMAFKKLITGADLFSGIPAVPSVSAALVLVNKDGEVAASSGQIEKGKGRRFEGKKANMLQQDHVRFDDKSVAVFKEAIDKAADDVKKRLEKDFSKLK